MRDVGTVQSCSTYGKRDDAVPARLMASRLRLRPSFWLSSDDLYGWGMMVGLFHVSLLISRKSSTNSLDYLF